MNSSEGLVHRKRVTQENGEETVLILPNPGQQDGRTGEGDSQEADLTLMEEVFLLGLKDKEGYTSFWNDSISVGLRACIIAELGLRGRVELECAGMRRKPLLSRKLILINDTPTGDVLLDETIRHIKENIEPETVENWLEYLNGDSWNPLKVRYHLKKVRKRLAKNLAEKGVLVTKKQNFLLFNMTTHPLSENTIKYSLMKKVQDALLSRWVYDSKSMDKRMLALIFLAHASEVLTNAFTNVNEDDSEIAMKRVNELLDIDFEQECLNTNLPEVLWAVFATLYS